MAYFTDDLNYDYSLFRQIHPKAALVPVNGVQLLNSLYEIESENFEEGQFGFLLDEMGPLTSDRFYSIKQFEYFLPILSVESALPLLHFRDAQTQQRYLGKERMGDILRHNFVILEAKKDGRSYAFVNLESRALVIHSALDLALVSRNVFAQSLSAPSPCLTNAMILSQLLFRRDPSRRDLHEPSHVGRSPRILSRYDSLSLLVLGSKDEVSTRSRSIDRGMRYRLPGEYNPAQDTATRNCE